MITLSILIIFSLSFITTVNESLFILIMLVLRTIGLCVYKNILSLLLIVLMTIIYLGAVIVLFGYIRAIGDTISKSINLSL